jgi:photosystem II stability/assembly factor-like uncharacterized protein
MKYVLFGLFFISSYTCKCQWDTLLVQKGVSFRALALGKNGNLWLGGSNGHIYKSENKGKTWQNKLKDSSIRDDFRGIVVLKNNTILAMSAGPAEEKKTYILRTKNEGISWQKAFESDEKEAFFDCMKFKNHKVGYLLGDPVAGKVYLLKTKNGGLSWQKLKNLPEIAATEASYAASNSSIVLHKKKVWFATQNRIFYSENNGKKWQVFDCLIGQAAMQGIFGIFKSNSEQLLAMGGDYNGLAAIGQFGVLDSKTGKWQLNTETVAKGASECIAQVAKNKLIAVGTAGTYISDNDGKNWRKIGSERLHTVVCSNGYCVAAGSGLVVGGWF